MHKLARGLGRLALWAFAVVGVVTLVHVNLLRPMLRDLAGNNAHVLEVIEAPNGLEAAVVYFHNHENSSAKYIAVKLVLRPFPETGDDIGPYEDVFRIFGEAADWKDPKPIRVQWWKKSALMPIALDVCAPQFVRFDRGLFADATTDVTLCQAPQQ